MTYATQSDLETRYGAAEILRLADRDANGTVDPGVVDAAILAAQVEIDGYLAVRYALPLSAVPAAVTQLACDIARYRLWKDRASEQARKGYEDAVDQLKRLASGTMRLVGVTGIAATAADPLTAHVRTPARQFDAESLAGY